MLIELHFTCFNVISVRVGSDFLPVYTHKRILLGSIDFQYNVRSVQNVKFFMTLNQCT